MGRRRPQSEASGVGSWMDTYGDLVTLLLTFFVLLYSFSSIDAKKWEALVKSLSRNGRPAAQGAGAATAPANGADEPLPDDIEIEEPDVESETTGSPGVAGQSGSTEGTTAWTTQPTTTATARPATPTPRATPKPGATTAKPTLDSAMNGFYQEMRGYLNTTPLAGSVSLEQKGAQMLIRLRVSLIFEPGSDRLKPEAQQILSETAVIIRKNLALIKSLRTEGHTDSVTPPAGNIESKWELAALRAARVLQQIVNRTGISQTRVYTVGYGSARPVSSNNTEAGRNDNNRVDIIIVH